MSSGIHETVFTVAPVHVDEANVGQVATHGTSHSRRSDPAVHIVIRIFVILPARVDPDVILQMLRVAYPDGHDHRVAVHPVQQQVHGAAAGAEGVDADRVASPADEAAVGVDPAAEGRDRDGVPGIRIVRVGLVVVQVGDGDPQQAAPPVDVLSARIPGVIVRWLLPPVRPASRENLTVRPFGSPENDQLSARPSESASRSNPPLPIKFLPGGSARTVTASPSTEANAAWQSPVSRPFIRVSLCGSRRRGSSAGETPARQVAAPTRWQSERRRRQRSRRGLRWRVSHETPPRASSRHVSRRRASLEALAARNSVRPLRREGRRRSPPGFLVHVECESVRFGFA